jgi:hypothetical protein
VAKKRKRASQRRSTRPAPPPSNPRRVQLLVLAGAAVVGVLVAAGTVWVQRDDEPRSNVAPLLADDDPGPVHVHGLGVDPADGSLFIATHTGLWRSRPGGSRAERVGNSHQDTMGFTILGPRHFLGSGHPDNAEEPPQLGLIESRDAGEEWTPISLYGEADFHVLRAYGSRLYGYDASNDRLLVSRDAGRTWEERERPAPMLDLTASPADPARLVAATDEGLFESPDSGRSWRRVSDGVGLLGWPRPSELLLVGGDGDVLASRDLGRRWTKRGTVGGVPAAFLARSPTELYVALHDGTIERSRDGGRTWTLRSAP